MLIGQRVVIENVRGPARAGSRFPCRFRSYVQPSLRLNPLIGAPYLMAMLAWGDSLGGEQCGLTAIGRPYEANHAVPRSKVSHHRQIVFHRDRNRFGHNGIFAGRRANGIALPAMWANAYLDHARSNPGKFRQLIPRVTARRSGHCWAHTNLRGCARVDAAAASANAATDSWQRSLRRRRT